MKRIFALALTTLMLWGCQGNPIPETTPPTTEPTQPTTATEPPAPVYQPLERYTLPYTDIRAAAPMGGEILLTVGEPATLVKLRASDLALDASAKLPENAVLLAVADNGVCYGVNQTLVFLDARLRESGRVTLPLAATGTPLVSADLQKVYYTAGNTVRSVSRSTGHDRPLRDTTAAALELAALHLEGTLLECRSTDNDGTVTTLFFDTATGELVRQYADAITLSTHQKGWLATISQNGYVENLVSKDGTLIQGLNPSYAYTSLTYLGADVVITAAHDGYLSLDLCEIPSGFSKAMTTLNGATEILDLWEDAEGTCIWVLTDQDTLYRWDLELTAVEDQVSCITPYYTRENPDTDGLARLEERILELEEQYAIDLHIGEDALTTQSAGYTLVSEYRVPVLENAINTLVHELTRLDSDFLAQVAAVSHDDRIHISLVQSISGNVEMDTPVNTTTAQFWSDLGNTCIVLTLGETLAQDFYHGLAHIMDAQILSKSDAFDDWESLNPPDFEYDYSYNLNQNREEGSNPEAFMDVFSMSFPTEDRASVFQYAMTEGCEAFFQSKLRQAKLATLCTGIRETFGITTKSPLPWEQYLSK